MTNDKNDKILITNRFFMCVDLLKDSGRMPGGLKEFCERHEVNRSALSIVRYNPETASLKVEYVKWLCDDYNVNVNYIMFGRGKVINPSK